MPILKERDYMGRKALDLTGQRFGRLVAVEKTDIRKDGKIVWKCICDCGNYCFVMSNILKRGMTNSCGCLAKEISLKRIKSFTNEQLKVFQKPFCFEGTRLPNLTQKIAKNNKSGVKGVFFEKNRSKYCARITFKRKVYRLGYFNNLSDAAAARKQAEENLFGNFLKWYEEYKKNGDADVAKRTD
jgi:hypothetical protein